MPVKKNLFRSPGFALYRLPWERHCQLVLQTAGEVERSARAADVIGRPGFVMAPFHPSDAHPTLSIRPDVTAIGWEKIVQVAEGLTWRESAPSCSVPSLPPPDCQEAERARYERVCARFIASLREGRFDKLVLSRASVTDAPEGFSPLDVFRRACAAYPRMMIYLCHTPWTGTWLGCTPEILLSGRGCGWHTVALAGTQPMQGESLPTHWDGKNREEQAFVADYIRRVIRSQGGTLVEEQGPYTARAGQVAHLKTDFHFRLPHLSAYRPMLEALHPTPAVCGLPKDEALRFILEQEGYDRSYYSGFVGRTDTGGQTDLYVNLRCMETDGKRIRFYAGGGILPQSDVRSEWEETEEKMDTLRRILVNDL